MRATVVALPVLAIVGHAGCSQNAELERARAEADAAKTELAKVKVEAEAAKTELALLKAQLAALGGEQNKAPANSEQAVIDALHGFFDDLHNGFARNAYLKSMTVAYQKRMDYKAFEQFLDKYPVLKNGGNNFKENAKYRMRKLDKDNAYECDFATLALRGVWMNINISLRLVEEEGRWKIDDFVEVKESKFVM